MKNSNHKSMKKFLLTLLGALMTIPVLPRDFCNEFGEDLIWYNVISERDRTCKMSISKVEGSKDVVLSVAFDDAT